MKKVSLLSIALLLLLTACSSEEQVKKVQIDAAETNDKGYELVDCSRQDIREELTASLTYSVTKSENYSFSVKNKIVEFVYVKKGDTVKKGDVLAVLESEDLDSKLRDLKFELEGEQLNLKHTIETRDNAIETEEYMYLYTKMTDEDTKARDEAVESINKSYESTIKSIEDQITITTMKIEDVEQEYKDSRLVAGFDGIVSFCKTTLEGNIANVGEEVIRIYEPSTCLLISSNADMAEYFEEGVNYEMKIGTGSAERLYTVTPCNLEDWGEKLYFSLVEATSAIAVGDYGKVTIVTAQKENVLSVPSSAVHKSGKDRYVYYLDDKGVKRMKWVKIGLVGKEYTEIVEGLSEGEYIILK